ncbi:type IV secretory system conjugative DNA transfer family protein [Vibrio agarivorans]|uniref:type IV secretory system conjugative DNA transfer family protein n=1 Tax=Vibrio agarivorans TaxID=153622 RepID=UPI0025B564D7|nr:type IV secretory system conjugative DNA transfer family protein [Vibrio agarivorans]MDN3661078.1 type IV secretory system conjugative DNA transfer family protein [Vibrio agarivorans]
MPLNELKDLNSNNAAYLEERKQKSVLQKKKIQIAGEYAFNHGYMTEMQYLETQMMANKQRWDTLLDFRRLSSLLSDGAAAGMYLVGGVVDEIDSSIKTVDDELIISGDEHFRYRKKPTLRVSPPHWFDYVFPNEHRDLSPPARSMLPSNQEERELWKRATEKGWERGIESAQEEYRKRMNHLFSDLIGITNYWYLVEVGMITEVNVDSTNYHLEHRKLDGLEELTINPTTIQITSQSQFVTDTSQWSGYASSQYINTNRKDLRDSIITGAIDLQEVQNSDVTIYTTEHEQLMDELRDEQFRTLLSN